MSLTNKENDEPMAQQRKADYSASVYREMREWREEFKQLHGSSPEELTEEERAALVSEIKFKKITEAPKAKKTHKSKPSDIIYGEEYFEGKNKTGRR